MSFSLDPMAGEAYISLYVDGQGHTHLGRLRRLDRLSVDRGPAGYEGLRLWFSSDANGPLVLRTRPRISLSWNVKDLGTW
ncbi:hypothetical protein ABZV91_31375 [Nocardia sp. NPDC004568]|uniref:hypothetical protein n=1 Tax=Nocardia sp. NPDC004568 TaxID=3154551 RepID=UPI0033A95538